MLRLSFAVVVALLLLVGNALAADKEVKCKLVKVDAKNMVLTIVNKDGKQINYDINGDTKFLGPKGGASELGVKDDRLTKGAELTLVVAGNNKTVREVRLPERKPKDKDKDK